MLPYLSLGVEAVANWFGRLWRQSVPRASLVELSEPAIAGED